MATRTTCHGLWSSPLCLGQPVCSALEAPVLYPVRVCPEGPPPSPVELLRRGSRLPGGGVMSCVSCVPASCVLIWLFGISCPCWVWLLVNSVQLCFSYCRWLSCVFTVLSVQLVLVWSTRYSLVFLSVSALSCPALPCLSTLKTVILRISSSPCSLFLPRVCTMTHVFLASLSLLHNASDLCDWQP